MIENKNVQDNVSPFHKGEQLMQTKLGVRDNMERFGSRVIRDHMPNNIANFTINYLTFLQDFQTKRVHLGLLFYVIQPVLLTRQIIKS
jgi:hypothetical protein